MVQPDRPKANHTAHAPCMLDNIHSEHIKVLTAFSMVTMVTRTRVNVPFIRTLPVFMYLNAVWFLRGTTSTYSTIQNNFTPQRLKKLK